MSYQKDDSGPWDPPAVTLTDISFSVHTYDLMVVSLWPANRKKNPRLVHRWISLAKTVTKGRACLWQHLLPPIATRARICPTHPWMSLVPLNKYLLNTWLNEWMSRRILLLFSSYKVTAIKASLKIFVWSPSWVSSHLWVLVCQFSELVFCPFWGHLWNKSGSMFRICCFNCFKCKERILE